MKMQANTNITVQLRFYAELNDFLSPEKREITFLHSFQSHSTIKDVIESFGVPHTEIDLILANNKSVDFNYRAQRSDRISVYPVFGLLDITPIIHLRPMPLRISRFILDVHLGKLTKYLRLLGFDSLYSNQYSDANIIKIAESDKRIVLTRDIGLLKNKKLTHGYWLRETMPLKQIKEVIKKFDLVNQCVPFSRCLECNNKIIPVKKEEIIDQVPPKSQQYNLFYQCAQCKRVYWQGTHFDKLEKIVKSLMLQ